MSIRSTARDLATAGRLITNTLVYVARNWRFIVRMYRNQELVQSAAMAVATCTDCNSASGMCTPHQAAQARLLHYLENGGELYGMEAFELPAPDDDGDGDGSDVRGFQ